MRDHNEIFRKGVTYDKIKYHEDQDFTVSLKNTFLETPQREGGGQIDSHPSLFRLNEIANFTGKLMQN